MFRLDVWQGQWLFIALLGGTAAALAIALWYTAVWRARREEPAATPAGAGEEGPARPHPIPWILIVVYVLTGVFMAAYLVLAVMNPPTW